MANRVVHLTPLPPTSSLLRFGLFEPLSTSTSPTACLIARVSLVGSTPNIDDGSHQANVQDLRNGSRVPSIEVYRVLDPGTREPFISMSRVFLACNLSPLEGLLRFKLQDYDSTLAGIAPFRDIWVPLKLASTICGELSMFVFEELAGLLDWESRKAFSVEDKEEGGIVHNWRISSDRIDPARYSTSTMLTTSFPRIHLLPTSNQIRTLVPTHFAPHPASSLSNSVLATNFDSLWSHLVNWSIEIYESYLDHTSSSLASTISSSSSSLSFSGLLSPDSGLSREGKGEKDLTPSLLFTTVFSYLSLTFSLPSSTTTTTMTKKEELKGFSYTISEDFKLERKELGKEMALQKERFAFIDALSRIVGREWRRVLTEEVAESVSFEERNRMRDDGDRVGEKSEKLGNLDERLRKIEEAVLQNRVRNGGTNTEDGNDGVNLEMNELLTRMKKLEERLGRLEQEEEDSNSAVESFSSASIEEDTGAKSSSRSRINSSRRDKTDIVVKRGHGALHSKSVTLIAFDQRDVTPWLFGFLALILFAIWYK